MQVIPIHQIKIKMALLSHYTKQRSVTKYNTPSFKKKNP